MKVVSYHLRVMHKVNTAKTEPINMETTIRRPNALDTAQEESTAQHTPAPIPSQKSPQEFYAEITKRVDVRIILKELATG